MFIMALHVETSQIIADPEKRRAWITFQLRLKGENFTTLANRHGVSRQAVRQAMYKPYPRMERILAEALGLKPEALFPERYNADGTSTRRMGRPKKSLVNGSKFVAQCKQKSPDERTGEIEDV